VRLYTVLWGRLLGHMSGCVGRWVPDEDGRESMNCEYVVVGMHKHTSTVSRSRIMSVSVVVSVRSVPASAGVCGCLGDTRGGSAGFWLLGGGGRGFGG
jgi:hypothetical protein